MDGDIPKIPNTADRSLITGIFERVTDAFVALDKDWKYTYVNKRAGEIFGRNPESLLGKHIWTEFPEGIGRPFHLAYEQAMKEQQAVRFNEYYPPYDRWFENIVYPSPDGVSIYFHDITASKRAEELIAGQKAILEMIANNAPLNESLAALLKLLERQASDMISSILLLDPDGIHVRHGAAPSLPPAFITAIDGQKIGPAAGSCGTAMHRKERVIVEDIATDPLWDAYRDAALPLGLRACWSTPILDATRRVLGSYAIYYREPGRPTDLHLKLIDIATHLAAIAITHTRIQENLRASEAKYRKLFDYAPVGIVVADQNSYYLDANKCACQMLGYTHKEFVALHASDIVARQEAGFIEPALREIKATQDYHREWKFRRKNGSSFDADVSATVMPDGNLLGVLRDVTEQRQLEQQFYHAQKLEALGRLAGGIAHDFNNLLAIISGRLEILLQKRHAEEQLQHDLEPIRSAAERAVALTKQLLTLGRKRDLELKLLDLNASIAESKAILQGALGKNIELSIEPDGALPPIKADAGQLGQVLLNLAINARDAMPNGGKITIRTHSIEKNGLPELPKPADGMPRKYVLLSVSDTGCGMSAETQAHIFEPFFTTKPDGKGTGLGLAVVDSIVKQRGGFIELASEPERGTTFNIYWPVGA